MKKEMWIRDTRTMGSFIQLVNRYLIHMIEKGRVVRSIMEWKSCCPLAIHLFWFGERQVRSAEQNGNLFRFLLRWMCTTSFKETWVHPGPVRPRAGEEMEPPPFFSRGTGKEVRDRARFFYLPLGNSNSRAPLHPSKRDWPIAAGYFPYLDWLVYYQNFLCWANLEVLISI